MADKLSNSLSDAIANKIVIENKTAAQKSINASSWTTVTMDVSKTGYTPKMVSVTSTYNVDCVIIGAGINGNNAEIAIKNLSGSAQTVTPHFDVLYIKN